MIASKLELSPCAVSVLGQLFVEGPTSDDNIMSRAGRCDLVSAGLAFHEAGLSSLTPDGVRMAKEWDLCSLYARRDRRWYLKVRANPRPEGAAVSHSESGAPSGRIDRFGRRRGVEHGERATGGGFGFHRRNVAFLPARADALGHRGESGPRAI
jgi:hypothetical protein